MKGLRCGDGKERMWQRPLEWKVCGKAGGLALAGSAAGRTCRCCLLHWTCWGSRPLCPVPSGNGCAEARPLLQVFEWVMCSSPDRDSHRFMDIIEAAVQAKEVGGDSWEGLRDRQCMPRRMLPSWGIGTAGRAAWRASGWAGVKIACPAPPLLAAPPTCGHREPWAQVAPNTDLHVPGPPTLQVKAFKKLTAWAKQVKARPRPADPLAPPKRKKQPGSKQQQQQGDEMALIAQIRCGWVRQQQVGCGEAWVLGTACYNPALVPL